MFPLCVGPAVFLTPATLLSTLRVALHGHHPRIKISCGSASSLGSLSSPKRALKRLHHGVDKPCCRLEADNAASGLFQSNQDLRLNPSCHCSIGRPHILSGGSSTYPVDTTLMLMKEPPATPASSSAYMRGVTCCAVSYLLVACSGVTLPRPATTPRATKKLVDRCSYFWRFDICD